MTCAGWQIQPTYFGVRRRSAQRLAEQSPPSRVPGTKDFQLAEVILTDDNSLGCSGRCNRREFAERQNAIGGADLSSEPQPACARRSISPTHVTASCQVQRCPPPGAVALGQECLRRDSPNGHIVSCGMMKAMGCVTKLIVHRGDVTRCRSRNNPLMHISGCESVGPR